MLAPDNPLQTAGYVVTIGAGICAAGPTKMAAWSDLAREMRKVGVQILSDAEAAARRAGPDDGPDWIALSSFSITPATAALLAEVDDRGGGIGWGIVGGVYCTRDEQDQAAHPPLELA